MGDFLFAIGADNPVLGFEQGKKLTVMLGLMQDLSKKINKEYFQLKC